MVVLWDVIHPAKEDQSWILLIREMEPTISQKQKESKITSNSPA